MSNATHEIATEVQNRLLGKQCWYVSCGGAAGTTFQLALGKRVARRIPLTNPAHTEEYRSFEGEANLLVWCTWRLDSPEKPLTSADDAVENVVTILEELVNRTILKVWIDLPGWDLHLEFAGGLRLNLFCDHVRTSPSVAGNWDLFLIDKLIAIGAGSMCEVERRSS